MTYNLKALTLNCWGLPISWPVGTKDKSQRMNAIADRLSAGEYDVVALQEIWCDGDYELIKNKAQAAYPYTFYFHSGVIGSGLCILSKHPIFDTMMFRYTLNGYAHHVHRGDWLGGKVVGLTKIRVKDSLNVFVYCTHLHAQYGIDDPYLTHRTVQAFEMSQFIQQTAPGADVVLAMGDFNLEPHDLGMKLILANAGLNDCWEVKPNKPESGNDAGYTSDTPTNAYSDKQFMYKPRPNGQRIDYICYKAHTGMDVRLTHCDTDFHGIPGTEISYSDHEGLVASFSCRRRASTDVSLAKSPFSPRMVTKEDAEPVSELLDSAVAIVEPAIAQIGYDRAFYIVWFFLLLLAYFYTIDVEVRWPILALPMMLLRFAVTLVMAYFGMNGIISATIERKFLVAARDAIRVVNDFHRGQTGRRE